jgi:hypothetical protein
MINIKPHSCLILVTGSHSLIFKAGEKFLKLFSSKMSPKFKITFFDEKTFCRKFGGVF